MSPRPVILIIHGSTSVSRKSVIDYFLSFNLLSDDFDLVYHHCDAPVTDFLRRTPFRLVIFSFDFLIFRISFRWPQLLRKWSFLGALDCRRVALTQDCPWNCATLDDALIAFKVDTVFSVFYRTASGLFPRALAAGVQVRPALTAYFDTADAAALAPYAQPHEARGVHIGTRVSRHAASFGRYGLLKADLAERLGQAGEDAGLIVDVSTSERDAFVGDGWYRFLGNCRATFTMNGGYGMADPSGAIKASVDAYVAKKPGASFEEIEAHCFAGLDGKVIHACESPRLFEAAALRTCQIMPRSDYLGKLEAWEHYIPLETDGGNLDEVMEAVADARLCREIADRCHDALFAGDPFSKRAFVMAVVDNASDAASPAPCAVDTGLFAKHRAQVERVAALNDQLGPASSVSFGTLCLFIGTAGAQQTLLDAFEMRRPPKGVLGAKAAGVYSSDEGTAVFGQPFATQVALAANLFAAKGVFDEAHHLVLAMARANDWSLALPWDYCQATGALDWTAERRPLDEVAALMTRALPLEARVKANNRFTDDPCVETLVDYLMLLLASHDVEAYQKLERCVHEPRIAGKLLEGAHGLPLLSALFEYHWWARDLIGFRDSIRRLTRDHENLEASLRDFIYVNERLCSDIVGYDDPVAPVEAAIQRLSGIAFSQPVGSHMYDLAMLALATAYNQDSDGYNAHHLLCAISQPNPETELWKRITWQFEIARQLNVNSGAHG
jgi:hypothetical protein